MPTTQKLISYKADLSVRTVYTILTLRKEDIKNFLEGTNTYIQDCFIASNLKANRTAGAWTRDWMENRQEQTEQQAKKMCNTNGDVVGCRSVRKRI